MDTAVVNYTYDDISEANIKAINQIKSFAGLKNNWDGYHAVIPSPKAIQKAISFIIQLAHYGIDVFFTAPAPDGEILIEIKHGNANLEFEFSNETDDTVCATYDGEFISEAALNDTTLISYLKWLICPDGNCPPSL